MDLDIFLLLLVDSFLFGYLSFLVQVILQDGLFVIHESVETIRWKFFFEVLKYIYIYTFKL